MRHRLPQAPLLGGVLLFAAVTAAAGQDAVAGAADGFDVLIMDGRVYDGTGNPWFPADIGIRDGRIAAIGELEGVPARRVIEADGLVVTPGFIDIHSHADEAARRRPKLRDDDVTRKAAPNLIAQGVTTVVVNQDGRSPWPIGEQRAELEREGVGPNVALLIGHGAVRGRVMGDDVRRPATADEVERMRALVRQGMEEGAYGLSAGLEYDPGRWSETGELVRLVAEVEPFGGVYIVHQRSEGAAPMWFWPSEHAEGVRSSADPVMGEAFGPPTLLDAVRETIEIGERTGAVVVASHIKAKGADYWGSSRAAIQLVERARARGVRIYADQYPYDTSGSDGSTVLIPGWVFAELRDQDRDDRDYTAALRSVLDDDDRAVVEALRRDIAYEIARRGGAERVVVFDHPDSTRIGRSVGELARERGVSPVEMAVRLQLEGDPARPGGGRLRGFSMSEELDLLAYMERPWTATASDAGIAREGDGPVHARYYGTFPRKIRRYALELDAIAVEDAIRSMTTLPAQILGLEDRGSIREGARADVVVLDLDRLRDTATFFEPHRHPEGVEYVLVNGELVIDGGEPTWTLPGRILTPEADGRARRPGITTATADASRR
ncbi:MAG: N-acyl-D-amino-acid deacylase family protein [Gemmatimonadota bacterium]